jgi:restriction endonuclease S subunit
MNFEETRINEIADVVAVTRGFPTQRATQDGEVPVMSIADLRNDSPPRHFADRADIEDLALGYAQPGDVLVAIEGGTLGETLVVPDGVDEFVPSQQAATLRVLDTRKLDPWFLGAWLSTEQGREQVRRLARGSGIQRIAMKDLPSLVIKIPPLADQQAIGARFRAFEASIQSHRSVAACLAELRDLDLQVVFAERPTAEARR